MTAKNILKKTGRIVLYTISIVLFLVLVAIIFLNTHYAKQIVRNKLQTYLQNKIKTKLEIGMIDYSFPRSIALKNLYIEDMHKDTLLYGAEMLVDLDMIKLIWGETYIRKVVLKNIKANINRSENDSNYNYQFLINAFASPKTDKKPSTDTGAIKFNLKEVLLNDFTLRYNDKYAGNNFFTNIKNLNITLDQFQTDKLLFKINQLKTDGVDFSMLSYNTANSTKQNTIDTTPNTLKLFAKQLDFNHINITVENKDNGMVYANQFNHLYASNTDVNLALQKASADKIILDSSAVQFISPSNQVKDTSGPSKWIVSLKSLQLNNDQFQFDNNEMPLQKEGLDYAHINAERIKINAANIFYSNDSTTALIHQLAFKEKSGLKVDTTHAKILYTNKGFAATELYLKTPQSLVQNTVQLQYNDIAQLTSHPKNSKIAATLLHSTIAVNDLYTIMPSVQKYLPVEKFKNNLIHINTEVNGTLEQLNIPFLQLQGLAGSSINAKAVLYNITDSQKLAYDVTVYYTHILKNDLLKFITYNEYIGDLPNELSLNTRVKGNMKNTVIDLDANSSLFKLKGKIDLKNFDNTKLLQYNAFFTEGRVDNRFITKMIPKNAIPSSIQLPNSILFKGAVKGDMDNVSTDLILGGSYGIITAKGFVSNFKNAEAAKYDMKLTSKDFAVGKLLKQDTVLGNVTLTASAIGTGFNYKTMQSSLKVNMQSAVIEKYNYNNVILNADFTGGKLSSTGSINDSNLQMKYTAVAIVSGEYPSAVDAKFIFDTVQLQKLHLYNDKLNASLQLNIKAADLSPANMNLYASLDSLKLNVKNKLYHLDSINLKAISTNGKKDIAFKSPLADIVVKGSFDYDKIAPSLLQYIDKYYDVVSTPNQVLPPQQIAINGVIKKHPLIADLIQGLVYEDIHFNGGYASQNGDSALNFHALIPKLIYTSYLIDSGKMDISSLNNKIDYTVYFATLHVNKNVFYATSIKGDVINDSLHIVALTKDKKNSNQYGIGAGITAKDKSYTLSLQNDLLINYEQWKVSPDNKISYSPQGILVKNFLIENGKTKVSANSKENINNSPIDIDIVNFDIKDIASITNTDTLMAAGIINGKINISGFDKKLPAFIGELSIDSLAFMQQPIGNLKFIANNKGENTINAVLSLTGNDNIVDAKGNYYLNNEENQFDLDLKIKKLNMAALQAFTAGNLTRSSGSINGDVKLSGNFKEPQWNGTVHFDAAKFTVAKTGVPYLIDQQKIVLKYPSIGFSKFAIKDSIGNTMTVDGEVVAQSISEYDLALNIHSKNFTLLNTRKAVESQFYGYASANADISVLGSTSGPEIEGNITLNNKSDVTIVLPEHNIDKDAAKSVVRFIDRDTFPLPEKIAFTPEVEQKPGVAQYLNYNLNIKINKNSALTVIIDPSSGDELKVLGDAELNAGVDPGGNIVLAGNYALKSGYYILNYQFLKRQFNLLEGSTIAFSGTPMDAQIDITAEYIANTSASDLLENEVGQMDAKMANTFNQKIPFRVLLYLKGNLKKPVISFDIQLPDESSNLAISSEMRTTIENKLVQIRGDVAVTNKEIFSLLLLGHFVGEQSTDFFKGNGTSIDGVARESVSKFLSSALNQIASDLFKGVDIDLKLNSYQDFSSGDVQQKTDLNIAVSKSFLNNRLTVTAGKNFGVEGQDAGAKSVQQNNNSFPDITLNYKLSRDGRYAMRAYRKDQFEVTVDGYVVETGVAFVVTYDFDKFKELFQKRNRKTKKSGS